MNIRNKVSIFDIKDSYKQFEKRYLCLDRNVCYLINFWNIF